MFDLVQSMKWPQNWIVETGNWIVEAFVYFTAITSLFILSLFG